MNIFCVMQKLKESTPLEVFMEMEVKAEQEKRIQECYYVLL